MKTLIALAALCVPALAGCKESVSVVRCDSSSRNVQKLIDENWVAIWERQVWIDDTEVWLRGRQEEIDRMTGYPDVRFWVASDERLAECADLWKTLEPHRELVERIKRERALGDDEL